MENAGPQRRRKRGIRKPIQQRRPVAAKNIVFATVKRKRHIIRSGLRHGLQHHRPLSFITCRGNAQYQRRRRIEQASHRTGQGCADPLAPGLHGQRGISDVRLPIALRLPHQRRRRTPGFAAGALAARQMERPHAGGAPPSAWRADQRLAAPEAAVGPQPQPVPGENQPAGNLGMLARQRRGMGRMMLHRSHRQILRPRPAGAGIAGMQIANDLPRFDPVNRLQVARSPARTPQDCAGCPIRRYGARERRGGPSPAPPHSSCDRPPPAPARKFARQVRFPAARSPAPPGSAAAGRRSSSAPNRLAGRRIGRS